MRMISPLIRVLLGINRAGQSPATAGVFVWCFCMSRGRRVTPDKGPCRASKIIIHGAIVTTQGFAGGEEGWPHARLDDFTLHR